MALGSDDGPPPGSAPASVSIAQDAPQSHPDPRVQDLEGEAQQPLTCQPGPRYLLRSGSQRTALRGARLCADDDALLHDAGPEPFTNQAQDDRGCNVMCHHPHQPLVIDVGEVADVTS